MRKLLLVIFALLFFASAAFPINATFHRNYIEITNIDGDWVLSDTLPWTLNLTTRVKIHSIQFNPGTTSANRCVIKDAVDTNPAFFDHQGADVYDQKVRYYDGLMFHPMLDFSAGTFTTGASIIIILDQ